MAGARIWIDNERGEEERRVKKSGLRHGVKSALTPGGFEHIRSTFNIFRASRGVYEQGCQSPA